ncbi:glycosyltransferase [Aliivibrio fischeri]|uniref:Group 1 glycosyl transferase n=1 Tax=Aliivibrio fischeri SR5 TaxID=1088719 RepID=A0AAV3EXM6_ALIFS|nr:glycosyltransferase [Aliivibrio fischeri]EHN71517.1 group 1 glycosyl transferase [Aliivibrio fischeri SR5]
MKIAVVVNCLKMGGMERVAVNLADAFHEGGHPTDLIYLKNRKKELKPRNKEIPVHLFNLKKSIISSGVGILWLVTCKILNVFFRKTFPIWFAYAEAMAFNKKLKALEKQNGNFDLIIFRGQGTFEHLWPIQDNRFIYVCENVQKKHMYGKLSKWVFTKLFNNRNVVCVSQGALSSFIDMTETHNIRTNKAITLNNPNDFTKIKEDAEAVKHSLHNKPFILGLGRLVPQKNFTLLVEAYHKAISQYNIEQDLIIVGAGKDLSNIKATVEQLNLTDRVYFKGQQNNPFPWYQQAELFVLSSKFEGLGMVLIEALACGTKVVSTDSLGGVRQIMNGQLELFLAEENAEALAEKIHLALQQEWNPSFSNFVQETLNQFNGKTIINQYIKEFS